MYIVRDPDFICSIQHQFLKLWYIANEIYKNQKILYVWFQINIKNISNLSFRTVIVDAQKTKHCFREISWN